MKKRAKAAAVPGLTVSGLFIHPLKAGRAKAVETARIDYFGIVGDRRLMIVDMQGAFLTQRTVPEIAQVGATIDEPGRIVTLSSPHLPLLRVEIPAPGAATFSVVVWGDRVDAVDLGPDATRWLHACIGRHVHIVAFAPEYSRPVKKNARPADEVSFTDGFPVLIVSEASLAGLNKRLEIQVPMNRFRPNIVVRGGEPHAEDAWKRIRIGDCVLRAAGPSARCAVITTDQDTLEISREPLKTLATYRRGTDGKVYFGQNFIHETKHGSIGLGDTVAVLK